MKFGTIEVNNFMSIRHAEFDFKDQGLVLIQGVNEDSEAFESNGAGKSTLFSEAVVFALFGQTIRGQKADKVINVETKKDTSIILNIEDGEDFYRIERYRKHHEHKNHVRIFHNEDNITGKSDKDTDLIIQDILQMDFSTFTNSIMFGQGVTRLFASATDKEQKQILENMLQIDIYKQCQDKAKEHFSHYDKLRIELQGELDKVLNMKHTSEEMIKSLQDKEATLKEKVDQKIFELNEEWAENNTYLQTLYTDEHEKELDSLNELLQSIEEKAGAYKKDEDQLAELTAEHKSIDRDMSKVTRDIQDKMQELSDIRSGKNVPKTCRACGQDLPLKDTSHLENHLENDIEELQKEQKDLLEDRVLMSGLIDKVKEKLKGKEVLDKERDSTKAKIMGVKSSIKMVEHNRKTTEKTQESILKQIEEQEKQLKETYTELIDETVKQVKVMDRNIQTINSSLLEYDDLCEKYSFWSNAYGNQGIKSMLLDSVTPFLNKKANGYLSKLADSSIEVKFNTQTTLKSGEKRDKFAVEIINHNGDNEYVGNSGGEKRRIDLAVNLALQDLVSSRSNKRIDLIVYDECFEGMDNTGCETIIDILKEKAKENGSVMVITHNDSLKQLFNKSVVVRKEDRHTVVDYVE